MSSNELETFLKQYPSYKKTESLDVLRKTDYFRLDAGEHIYLDYTGGGIYAESQIQKHQNF
jgi:molybdenum cofactor sulfurtransferase